MTLPDKRPQMERRIGSEEQLEEKLSEPTAGTIAVLSRLDGDVLLLGAGGKMGPTMARMARRASDAAGVRRRIIAVSRFSSSGLEASLQAQGVETMRCDLLDRNQLEQLPEAANVIYLVGMKFGSTSQEARTWAMNAFLPGLVCEKFRRSRIAAYSTGNVYGLTPVSAGGAVETDALNPLGDYSMSCVGRERIFEHFSRTLGIPLALLRLNYATELRYGVLVDIALRVLRGECVDLAMGYLNSIWQGDANAYALCALAHTTSPPFLVNIAGPELLSVRGVAQEFGKLMNREVTFRGSESADAFLSNGRLGHRLFGTPRVQAPQMIHWIADWLQRGGSTLGKPTHFETRDGKF